MVEIISQEFKCQLKNGQSFTTNSNDFTTFLKANVLEKIQAKFNVRVFLSANLTNWYFGDLGGGAYKISADNLNLTGFTVGDSIKIRANNNSWLLTANITSIGSDFIYLNSVVFVTSTPLVNDYNDGTDYIYLNDNRDNLYYSFNIIPESDSDNYANIYDSTLNKYLAKDVIDSNPVLASWVGQTNSGNSGYVDVKKLANSTTGEYFSQTDTVALNYEIIHEFVVYPYITDETKDDVINGLLPENLRGDLTYKFVAEFDFRKSINNIDSQIVGTYSKKADIGGFGESANGQYLPYRVNSVNYVYNGNPVDSLYSGVTTVNVELEKLTGNFELNDKIVIYHSYILSDDEASLKQTDFKTLWGYDSLVITISSSSISSSGVIQNADALNISSNVCFLNFQINNESDKEYILGIGLGDYNETASNDSKGILLLDTNTYYKDTDISGLFQVSEFNLYEQYQNLTVSGFTDFQGVVQDDVLVKGTFWVLDGSTIDSFNLSYVATNGTETKAIYQLDFDVDFDVINGAQQINISESMGYDSNFNLKELKYKETISGKHYYEFTANMKLSHQDWLRAKETLSDFYDINQPLNGVNRDLVTYSGVNGYEVKLRINADIIYTGVTTTYNSYTTNFLIKDYEQEVDPTGLTGTLCDIKYYNLLGTELPTGIVPSNQDYLVHAIFKVSDLDANLYNCIAYGESGLGDNNDLTELEFVEKYIENDTVVFVFNGGDFQRIATRLYKETVVQLNYLLQENGFYLLQENGYKIII